MLKSMMSSFMRNFSPRISKPRNRFTDTFSHYTTIRADYIYPLWFKQYYPGDTVRGNIRAFGRIMTLMRPILDQLRMDFYAFEVPNRVLWEHWPNMMGVRRHRDDSIAYTVPTGIYPDPIPTHSLFAYLGWPQGVSNLKGSLLPLRMYHKLFNEYFRDENLQELVPEFTGDVAETPIETIYQLRKANKLHDRFTSAMVDTQKGDEVTVPLGSWAPVVGDGTAVGWTDGTTNYGTYAGTGLAVSSAHLGAAIGTNISPSGYPTTDDALGVSTNPSYSGLRCNLSTATAASINTLRMAIQLQTMKELDERYGTRINELIYGHFGVDVPDLQSQRVEYIGGACCKLSGQPIAQTSRSDAGESPQGTLTATGVFNSQNGYFEKTFGEWSIVMIVCCVRAPLHYQEGMARYWKKETREDFIWPELAHVGPQEIYNHEVFAGGESDPDEYQIFAYENRYDDERQNMDMITGMMSSKCSTPMDHWHVAQEFGTRPAYNQQFIESNVPMDRVMAITDEDHIYLDFRLELTEDRILPLYGNPVNLSRF